MRAQSWCACLVEVRDFESHVALDGGIDGLDVVRELLAAAPKLLRSGERDPEMWLEVGGGHPAVIEQWLGANSGGGEAGSGVDRVETEPASEASGDTDLNCIEIMSDLNGVARFIGITLRHHECESLLPPT